MPKLVEKLTESERKYFCSLIQNFDLDRLKEACIDVELEYSDDAKEMRHELLNYYRSPDGEEEEAETDEISADDYIEIIDNCTLAEARRMIQDENEKLAAADPPRPPLKARHPPLKDGSIEAHRLVLKVHFLGKWDPMRARFARYDLNGDGDLGADEVQQVIKDVGFKVDGDYINGTMEVFAKYDDDGNGSLGLEEFTELWNFLHLDVASDKVNEARLEFDKYDIDGDGVLGVEEITALCKDVGFNADENSVGGIMDIFAKFDEDGSGELEFQEFEPLWDFLMSKGAKSTGRVGAGSVKADSDEEKRLRKKFLELNEEYKKELVEHREDIEMAREEMQTLREEQIHLREDVQVASLCGG
jgi:Ca2+-binding EF-hand superfamily protein